jgi:DNA processing protein
VSEYFPGTPPLTYHFPERNRIISGLSRGVVIVEAPAKSGALITADYALDQGRELYVHRAGLSGPASAGVVSLSEDGARVVDSVADVCADLRLSPPRGKSQRPQELCSSKDGMTLARSLLDELSGKSVSHRG